MPSPASAANTPVVVAAEVLTALGRLDDTWQGLLAGKCGLRPFAAPDLGSTYPLGLLKGSGEIGSPARLEFALREVSRPLAAMAGIIGPGELLVATTKGAADELLPPGAKPWRGQAWQAGTLTAGILGCRGAVQTVSAACASGTLALIQAALKIRRGDCEVATVIGVDIASRFVLAGFACLQALDPEPCRPFAADRQGLSLGEGAGLLVLTSAAFAAAHSLPVLARVAGWGAASDATHITAPSREARGLREVLRLATGNGTVAVGGINAHGTGTRYNDAMEMTAFLGQWPKPPPIHSVKGALGHCLGAAGVIEAAIALRSLQSGHLPPTIGHAGGEFPDAPISGTAVLPLTCPTVLSCNSGFGGINAGILLAAPDR
ncbi:MAG: beta-ketoacyl synthase N-terminal-like domain-containing protein [Desulfobulbaceae bacterium]